MSTDWDIFCVDCKTQHRFNDANHRADMMRAIIKHAPVIAALVPLFNERDIWSLELKTTYGRIDAQWFLEHLGHKLVPISEYGEIDGECGEYFQCDSCKTSRACQLEKGHGGNHARKEERW